MGMRIRTDVVSKAGESMDIHKLSHFELAWIKEPIDPIGDLAISHLYDVLEPDEDEVVSLMVAKHHYC